MNFLDNIYALSGKQRQCTGCKFFILDGGAKFCFTGQNPKSIISRSLINSWTGGLAEEWKEILKQLVPRDAEDLPMQIEARAYQQEVGKEGQLIPVPG